MTVRELIELLSELRPDARVMVDGYEGGVKELQRATMQEVLIDYSTEVWYYGPHELVDSSWVDQNEGNKCRIESVVYLPR